MLTTNTLYHKIIELLSALITIGIPLYSYFNNLANCLLLVVDIVIIIIIVSIITVFAGVLFVHQPGANHAPRTSVTQVNHSVHTLSTFLRIRADPSMQIF